MMISTQQVIKDAIEADVKISHGAYFGGSNQYMCYENVEVIAGLLGLDKFNLISQVNKGFNASLAKNS